MVREHVLPDGWREFSARAPRSTHVRDASGPLLKARGIVELTVIVNDKSMAPEFVCVRVHSVPAISGMEYQKAHVKPIYSGTESVVLNNGTISYAKREWSGKEQNALPVKGNPVLSEPSALYLSQGVTLAPQSIQAVYVLCGTIGRCLLYERFYKLAKEGLRLHNALATIKTQREF